MKRGNEIKIGLLIITGIALLVWGINYMKGKSFFIRQTKLYAIYNHVDGLVSANPVEVSGLKIGHVGDVDFIPGSSGRIVVTLVIERNLNIPRNSIAKIISSDLMGAKSVEVIMGDAGTFIQNGDTLLSDNQLSLTEEVNRQVAPIKNKAENLLASMDSVLSVIQYVFNKDTRDNLAKSFQSIEKTVKILEKTSFRLDTLVSGEQHRIVGIFSNVESISFNLRNNNEKISHIIQNFSSISDSLAKSRFVSTINSTRTALEEFSGIAEKINKGEGSLGLLLSNDSLYNNISSTAGNLDKLIKDINENPRKYVQFSLFGKKYKPKNKPH